MNRIVTGVSDLTIRETWPIVVRTLGIATLVAGVIWVFEQAADHGGKISGTTGWWDTLPSSMKIALVVFAFFVVMPQFTSGLLSDIGHNLTHASSWLLRQKSIARRLVLFGLFVGFLIAPEILQIWMMVVTFQGIAEFRRLTSPEAS